MTETLRLPDGWEMATFDDITTGKVEQAIPREPVWYIDIRSIDRETKQIGDVRKVDTESAPTRARQWVKGGDVLVSMTRPNLNAVAMVPDSLSGAVASTGFDVLRTIRVPPAWVFYRVCSHEFISDVCKNVQGVVYPAIRPHDVRGHKLPVPPLSEQHRIVEAIESYLTRLDAAVASLERVQKNLKRYRASVLKAAVEGRLVPTEAELAKKEGRTYEPAGELLERILVERRKKWIENAAEKARAKAKEKARKAGKPWTHADDIKTLEKERAKAAKKYKEPAAPDTTDLPDLPEGWCWATIKHFADHRLGKMLDKAKNEGKPRIYLRNANVQWFSFDMDDIGEMRVTDEEFASVSVAKGDLVVCEGGEPGRCSVWEEATPIAIQKALHRVRVHPNINSWFLAYHLGADALSHRLDREFTGTTIKHFTGEAFRSHAFALPPASEQSRIVKAIQTALSLVDHLSLQLENLAARAARLRQSILKWAFEGKLVPQDPNDQPASVLLEQIRKEQNETKARI